MLEQESNEDKILRASERIQKASEVIAKAAKVIESLRQGRKICKECKHDKAIEDFPVCVSYYRIKCGELKAHRAIRNICKSCYSEQTRKINQNRITTKREFNHLF